eukprot:4171905-Pleurochrysis_carterae.AAC.2
MRASKRERERERARTYLVVHVNRSPVSAKKVERAANLGNTCTSQKHARQSTLHTSLQSINAVLHLNWRDAPLHISLLRHRCNQLGSTCEDMLSEGTFAMRARASTKAVQHAKTPLWRHTPLWRRAL